VEPPEGYKYDHMTMMCTLIYVKIIKFMFKNNVCYVLILC